MNQIDINEIRNHYSKKSDIELISAITFTDGYTKETVDIAKELLARRTITSNNSLGFAGSIFSIRMLDDKMLLWDDFECRYDKIHKTYYNILEYHLNMKWIYTKFRIFIIMADGEKIVLRSSYIPDSNAIAKPIENGVFNSNRTKDGIDFAIADFNKVLNILSSKTGLPAKKKNDFLFESFVKFSPLFKKLKWI